MVYGGNGKYGILSDVGVPMLQAGSRRRKKGFNQLGFSKLAQESESVAPDILVGMLQIITNTVA